MFEKRLISKYCMEFPVFVVKQLNFTKAVNTTQSVLRLALHGISPNWLVSHYTIDFHISEDRHEKISIHHFKMMHGDFFMYNFVFRSNHIHML